jgi:hypothetical protein
MKKLLMGLLGLLYLLSCSGKIDQELVSAIKNVA